MRLAVLTGSKESIGLLESIRQATLSVVFWDSIDVELKSWCDEQGIECKPVSATLDNQTLTYLVVNSLRKVPEELVANGRWLNLHSGLLPEWGGLNANAYAMEASAASLGFTLHRATPEFDSGPIVSTYSVPNRRDLDYCAIRRQILKLLSTRLLSDIVDWRSGRLATRPSIPPAHFSRRRYSASPVFDSFLLPTMRLETLSRIWNCGRTKRLRFAGPDGFEISIDRIRALEMASDERLRNDVALRRRAVVVETHDGSVEVTLPSEADRDALVRNLGLVAN